MNEENDRPEITDWQAWMKDCDLESTDEFMELSSLYHAISDKDSGYGYKIEDEGDALVVDPYDEYLPKLRLMPEDRIAMLNHLDELYGMPVEAYEYFLHSMEKDD